MSGSKLYGFKCPSISSNGIKNIFQCPKLDSCFSPCLRKGHIIEIVGKAGAGKTQVVLSTCVEAARKKVLPPLEDNSKLINLKQGVILYINTEGPFPITRLREIALEFKEGQELLDKILVEEISDLKALFECLEEKIPQMITHKQIEMIVIDSIAGPLRSEYVGDDWKEKTISIHKLGSALSQLARVINVPVLIVNQVSAFIDQPYQSFGRDVVPCFGIAFSNYVNTRVFVTRTDTVIKKSVTSVNNNLDGKNNQIKANTRIRTLTIDFSPLLPSGNPIHFVVNEKGINGVEITDSGKSDLKY